MFPYLIFFIITILCQSLHHNNTLQTSHHEIDRWTIFEHLWEKQDNLGYLTQLAVGRSHTKDINGNHYYLVTYTPEFDTFVSQTMLATGGMWEKDMLSLFLYLLHTRKEISPCVTVDAGAHVGTFTLFAASMGCHVLSFEMQFSSIALVHFSLRLSGYTHLVQQYNVALWNETGIELHWVDRRSNIGNADVFSATPGTMKNPVLSQRFDDLYTQSDDIFFMKMDIEKAEEYALQGMDTLIRAHRIQHIVVETIDPTILYHFLHAGYVCRVFTDVDECTWITHGTLGCSCYMSNIESIHTVYRTMVEKGKWGFLDIHCTIDHSDYVTAQCHQ